MSTQTAAPPSLKHSLPTLRAGSVVRERLLERLAGVGGSSVVSIIAPAGYGKTTLLRQWADRVAHVAYVRLDEGDHDPAVLLADLVGALSTIEPIPPGVLLRLTGRGTSPGLRAFQRLADVTWRMSTPAVLMLDEIHSLTGAPAVDGLSWLAQRLPDSLRLAIAGRRAPALPMARLAASGLLVSMDARDLAFDRDEAQEMAMSMGVELSRAGASKLVARTAGWPVAVYLSLLGSPGDALGDGAPTVGAPLVSDFMRTELLDPLPAADQAWLLRSSVLDVMSGPLCDAALETTGSSGRLESLERSNLLVHVLDEGLGHRYHPLFRALLREELDRRLPGEAADIARRAAGWCDRHGAMHDAVGYALMADDLDAVARLLERYVWPIHWAGRFASMERWLRVFDVDGVRDQYPAIAVIAGFMHALEGRRHTVESWLAAAERSSVSGSMPDGAPDKGPWVALLRGITMPLGLQRMAVDVRAARAGIPLDSPMLPTVLLEDTAVRLMSGSLESAAECAAEAVEVAEHRGAAPGLSLGLGLQAWLTLRSDDPRAAGGIARSGIARVESSGLDDSIMCALLYAVGARASLASGSMDEARQRLGSVNRLRPRLTGAIPWLAVLVRLEAIRACVAMADAASARALLGEVDDILRLRPDLGTLSTEAEAVRAVVATFREPGAGQWTLTAAELRLLAFLPTHLSFAEIAERLFVSIHTVKSQAVAVYGKLGVGSRRAAIERAVECGLLDDSVLRYPSGTPGTSGIG